MGCFFRSFISARDWIADWFASSSSPAAVTPLPVLLAVTSPKWDSLWSLGSSITVSWTGTNLEDSTLSIELWKDIPLLPEMTLGVIAAGVDAGPGTWEGLFVLAEGSIPIGQLYYVVLRIDGKPDVSVRSSDFEVTGSPPNGAAA